jgi:hypothetical protein
MTKVIINRPLLKKQMSKGVNSQIDKIIFPKIKKIIQDTNKELLNKYLLDEITKEIKAGKDSKNTSGTLGGSGNLFTFLGFEENSNPVEELADFLSNSIKIKSKKISKNEYIITIQIIIPSLSEIESITSLPWINKSWVKAIESGISGLGYYLYSSYGFKESRSEKAIQADKKISSKSFVPQKYMSDILKNISKDMVRNIKKSI